MFKEYKIGEIYRLKWRDWNKLIQVINIGEGFVEYIMFSGEKIPDFSGRFRNGSLLDKESKLIVGNKNIIRVLYGK